MDDESKNINQIIDDVHEVEIPPLKRASFSYHNFAKNLFRVDSLPVGAKVIYDKDPEVSKSLVDVPETECTSINQVIDDVHEVDKVDLSESAMLSCAKNQIMAHEDQMIFKILDKLSAEKSSEPESPKIQEDIQQKINKSVILDLETFLSDKIITSWKVLDPPKPTELEKLVEEIHEENDATMISINMEVQFESPLEFLHIRSGLSKDSDK